MEEKEGSVFMFFVGVLLLIARVIGAISIIVALFFFV